MSPPPPAPPKRTTPSSEEGSSAGAGAANATGGAGATTTHEAQHHQEGVRATALAASSSTLPLPVAPQQQGGPGECEAKDRAVADGAEEDHESIEVPMHSDERIGMNGPPLRPGNNRGTANTTTQQPPPGPDAFVRWYLGRDDDSGGGGGDGMALREEDPESGGQNNDVRSRPSRAEAEAAVRNFVGPRTNSLQREIIQLRRRRRSRPTTPQPSPPPGRRAPGNHQPPREGSTPEHGRRHDTERKAEEGMDDEPLYKSVSYRLVDTPVWHNFEVSLQDVQRTSKPALITRLRRVLSGESGRTALRQLARRIHHRTRSEGRTNPPIQRPNDRNDNSDDDERDDPVRSYIRDARFLTRVMIATIGFLASVVGFVVSTSSNLLLDVKNRWVVSVLDRSGAAAGFAAFLLVNLALGIAAHVPVAYRPVSAGSGIAEAKAVLNGILLPSCTEVQSAACKAVSVTFSGAASLPVGLEGPLIFTGLSIGSNIHRLLLMSGSERPGKPSSRAAPFPTLQTHRAQRDLAACGTAAGVTSAFFTPLGGVLFAMEEGCSFWSVQLAWQTFATSCTAVIFAYLWVLAFVQHKVGEPFQILSLGKFTGLPGDENSVAVTPAPLRFWFYALFAGMGVAAGILGSVWCEASRRLSIWRAQRNMGRRLKLLEVLVLVALSSTVMWWLPQAYRECSPLDATVAADAYFRSFGCPEGQYNQLATLLLNPPGEVSLNLLFWEGPDAFSVTTCLLAATIYLLVVLILFGSSISMGIFIPLLFVGACLGRALGVAMEVGAGTTTFAIVGSVAMLAGVTRILISITVIMMTATNTPYLVSCFMVTSLFARVTGKWTFGRDGIYDIILELKRIPFLASTSPTNAMFRGLQARDLIKSQPFVTLKPEHRVGSLLEALESNPHLPDFVVVDAAEGALLGVICREDIRVLLDHAELFYTHGESRREPKALTYEYLMDRCRRNSPETEVTHLQSIRVNLTDEELGRYVDLTPYISIAHYQFDVHGSCERAYELFRTLGLRTLVVTSPNGVPRGTVRRYDLKLLEQVNVDDRRKHLRQADRDLIFSFKSITSS